MKIAFFEDTAEDIRFFKEKLQEQELLFFETPINKVDCSKLKDVDIISIFVSSHITEEILDCLPNLKLIVTRSVGMDHIQLDACEKRNIKVFNIPDYGPQSIAEFTFALLLALVKRLPDAMDKTKKGIFSWKGLTGIELKDKVFGIIGTGRIGRYVAKIAKGFNMKVIAYDLFPNIDIAKEIGYEYVDMETLLKTSDIISLHVNLTKENYHMIGKREFEIMKKGVIILNVSRGALIDTEALIDAIKNGKVAYAGLDVMEYEKELKHELEYLKKENPEITKGLLLDNILMKLQNQTSRVIVTPHIAFNTKEALQRIREETVKHIKNFVSGV